METIVQSNQEHQAMTEDSSDRSDESSTMSQEYQSRGFEDYDIVKRLRPSNADSGIGRNESQTTVRSKDFRLSVESSFETSELIRNGSSRCDDVQAREMSLTLVKTKEYGFTGGHIGDVLNCHADRMNEAESTKELSQMCRTKDSTMKEALLNLAARQEYLAVSFERSPKEFNYLVDREIKEYGVAKGYNLTIDRMKDYNSSLERPRENHVNGLPVRERTNGVGILDNPRIHDVNEHRNIHVASRGRQNLESIVYDRMRRPHHHYLNRMDFTGQNLTNSQHVRQSSVTQQQQSQQQQQQQQQQIKSFTIDAILAHRNNQRERHQRNQQQQQRKMARVPRQECQEVTTTKSSSGTGNSGDTSVIETVNGASVGKAKRVRTIFTAEQLERLEGEFARQQYMVGPERLYLAHELRLTEAQVKVWFQNRRIKWRKVNHEQQCQAVSEHRQRFSLQPEKLEIHEDESNDTTNNNWCVNSAITATSSSDDTSLIVSCNQQNRDNRGSSIVKP